MKVLIIDRDTMFSNLLAGKIRAAGHEVIETTIKNDGLEAIGTAKVDVVFFDPSPMNDPKPIMLQIRRMVHTYPYLAMMTPEGDGREMGIRAGCNDGISKPLDPEALVKTLENAQRMGALIRRIGDETYDFPSSGGVISKSAFNQIFRSAIDRVARYNEKSHALFLAIANYDDIKMHDGKYATEYAISKLAQTLVRLRRQSDILAQTKENEYAIMLQRPLTETESLDAAQRFSLALDDQSEILANGVNEIHIDVSLVHLPTGQLDFHRLSRIKNPG